MSTAGVVGAAAAVCAGAMLGALLRWQVSIWLNPLIADFPLGTWLVNVVGGFVVGLAIGFFDGSPLSGEPWAPTALHWRLFVISGFCGGLTTFSTFSVEVVSLLQAGRMAAATLIMLAHAVGSFTATALGLLCLGWSRRWWGS